MVLIRLTPRNIEFVHFYIHHRACGHFFIASIEHIYNSIKISNPALKVGKEKGDWADGKGDKVARLLQTLLNF